MCVVRRVFLWLKGIQGEENGNRGNLQLCTSTATALSESRLVSLQIREGIGEVL